MNIENYKWTDTIPLPEFFPDYIRFQYINPCDHRLLSLSKYHNISFEGVVAYFKENYAGYLKELQKHFHKSYVNFNALQVPVTKIDVFEKEILELFSDCSEFALWFKFNDEHSNK